MGRLKTRSSAACEPPFQRGNPMSELTEFDSTSYMRPPRVDVRKGVALSIALLTALPRNPPPGVKKAGQRLRKATVALQRAWSQKERAAGASRPSSDKGPADTRID